MPRIDPLSLLRCLSVLLGPNGGIKSKDEVIRLANLMTKFSKKLVSKCIYIQILKSTTPDLLSQFMGAGGWNLIHMWLTDGIVAKNWALIKELLELLLLCPVDIERLKSNNCPKLIKGLSKEGSHLDVRTLASRLVEQWLKMVKGEAVPNTVTQASSLLSVEQSSTSNSVNQIVQSNNASISHATSHNNVSENAATFQSSDTNSGVNQQAQTSPRKTQLFLPNNEKPQTVSPNAVYKITIRDGKQVLSQVQTDAANINNNIGANKVSSEVADRSFPLEDEMEIEEGEAIIEIITADPKLDVQDDLCVVTDDKSFKNIDETDNIKSKDEKSLGSDNFKSTSDKENRDKKDDIKSAGSDKKSSSSKSSSKSSSSISSKHSSSSHRSGSHRSSSKNSSSSKEKSSREKDKDRYHSSGSSKSISSKSKLEREKEREKQKKDQAEKDKATLEKLQIPSLSSKIGKIPKKKPEEDKPGSSPSRKVSSESKDKLETIKVTTIPEKKNISMSIENRKNSQDQGSRPKTVKTFNSKFRSTGLEEEVKPPSRGTKKPATAQDKKVLPSKLQLKRPSPLRETGSTYESKKTKLLLDTPTTPPGEEKKGGIKLIPPKPKVMHLQESDMFMDALTASTKAKEPRKRKRRASLTKDGLTDAKRSESATGADGAPSPTSSPISSPPHAGDKVILPTFRFYQETLETEEDSKSNVKAEDGDDADNDRREKKEEDDDDDGSRTPTPDASFDDPKSTCSPEDPAALVSEALKKEELQAKPTGVLKSVLLLQKRKGPKKTLKWKTDLESIKYFELDETERVNVTKTFTDMKAMEKLNEREAFQMARKSGNEDNMEEKIAWRPLILIDQPPPLVEPGKDSREKEIQYAREKGILQALYFNRSMIPETPAEPDEDRHPTFVEPKIIPLEDLTDNESCLKDFSNIAWPEPKPQLPSPTNFVQSSSFFNTYRPNLHSQPQPQLVPSHTPVQLQQNMVPVNSIVQMVPDISSAIAPPVIVNTGGGGWRTGDGKIVTVPEPTGPPMQTYQDVNQINVMGGLPIYNADGYMMSAPEDVNSYNNFQGPPPGTPIYGGPPPPSGPPGGFQGPRGPPHRGRGGPGWFRGGPPRPPWRGGWRGNNKQPPGYRNFKNGYNNRVNCPPY